MAHFFLAGFLLRRNDNVIKNEEGFFRSQF